MKMALQIFTKSIPRILYGTQCKCITVANFQNYRNLSPTTHWCRFQSTQTTPQTNPKEILVYYGTLTPQLRAVKIFSLLTSITGLSAQPFLYNQLMSLGNAPLIVIVWSFVGFFTLGTPILLHLLARKYVTTLKYRTDTGTYVATTLNLLNMKRELEFKPDDVKVPEVLGVFTSFFAKGSPLFVDPRLFKEPQHYGRIMGYDKPLDLKLFKTSLNEEKKE